ncbi:LysR family transcriptional regulator [Hoeflea sp. TYP-13]|uniref:LysR family transcriptional regulator n=1 Tax=Hoeflea sp. TYP-13 TaxID=3230023 RepID=UPI0034C5E968
MDKNLAAFLAVARTRTLTDASDQLGLTQPSVTKRIANLEEEHGAELFHRHRRGMTLTAIGKVFFDRAKRIESEYRQCREEIAAIASAGLSVLRVGAGPLFHLNYVAGLFAELKSQYPNLKLELTTDNKYPIGQLLSEGELDVYLGIIPKEHLDNTIFVRYVTNVEHGIVIRTDDPNAKRDRIDTSDLTDYNWVIFADDPETERTIRKYCVPKAAIAPTIDVRTTSFATGLQLVRQGNFVMSAPLQLARRIESEGLVIRPNLNGLPQRRAGIHIRKSAVGYGSIQAILEYFDGIAFEQ